MQTTLKVFNGNRLPSLDGMRFIAALLVILGHATIYTRLASGGVTYFFVLSGMLFSWLFQREWAKHEKIDFKSFYIRRAFRIMPAYYGAILFTIVGKMALKSPIDYNHALASATFTANYYNAFNHHPGTGFDLFWSLGVEEQFYLIWPLCFAFFMSRGPRALAKFLVVAVLAVFTWRSYLTLGRGTEDAYLYNAFDTRFDSLALGCLTGLLMMKSQVSSTIKRITKTGFEPLLVIAGIAALDFTSDRVRFSCGLTIQSALMCVLLLQLVVLHEHPLWRWANHRAVVFLGTLSYSTYLFHGWGLAVGHKFHFLPAHLWIAVSVLVSLVLAYASYNLIEQPFHRLLKRSKLGLPATPRLAKVPTA